MLTDALDGTLSPADQAAFDLHLLSCAACSSMMADAQRGAAWLEMLRVPRPEPSATLLDRILAQTSRAPPARSQPKPPSPVPSNVLLGHPTLLPQIHATQPASNVLPFRSRIAAGFNLRIHRPHLLQPRLAMTAAMAFFSIALTLNLTGVRLSELRASDLRPSSIKRSFSQANAHVVRYYDNLRVVYELESRVHDLSSPRTPTATASPPPRPRPPQLPPTPIPTHSPPTVSHNNSSPPLSPTSRIPVSSPDPVPAAPVQVPAVVKAHGGNLHYVVAENRRHPFTPAHHISRYRSMLLSPASSHAAQRTQYRKGDWYELRKPSRSRAHRFLPELRQAPLPGVHPHRRHRRLL